MGTESEYIEKAFRENNRLTPVQVVFTDVNAYSKRRSVTQTQIVDSFMEAVKAALNDTAKEFIDFAQKRDINFATDVITLPSGDGAAVAFPFDGIPDAHLVFAKALLAQTAGQRSAEQCERFEMDGWCNCHPYYNLSIGISEGRGILYKDLNGNYNLAGDVINMAARVMGIAGKNQIVFTDAAYRQIVDLVEDPYLVDKFRTYDGVRIKHGLRITLHQFYDESVASINSNPVEELELEKRRYDIMKKMGFPDIDSNSIDKKKQIDAMESIAALVKQLGMPTEMIAKISGQVKDDLKGTDQK